MKYFKLYSSFVKIKGHIIFYTHILQTLQTHRIYSICKTVSLVQSVNCIDYSLRTNTKLSVEMGKMNFECLARYKCFFTLKLWSIHEICPDIINVHSK